MSLPKVYVISSHALSTPKLLECVRRDYPEGEVIAVYPSGHVVTPREQGFLDSTLVSSSASLTGVRGLFGLLRILLLIRASRPEEVVLQFESIKLRLFGIACRPRRLRAWLGNGTRLELPLRLRPTLADLFAHRVRGYGVTLRAWWHAFVLHAINEPPERPRR